MLVERVTTILQEVAAEVIEPRFANLSDGEVEEKAPKELVTSADTEAEALLVRRLGELLPGVPVVGEEGTSLDDVPHGSSPPPTGCGWSTPSTGPPTSCRARRTGA